MNDRRRTHLLERFSLSRLSNEFAYLYSRPRALLRYKRLCNFNDGRFNRAVSRGSREERVKDEEDIRDSDSLEITVSYYLVLILGTVSTPNEKCVITILRNFAPTFLRWNNVENSFVLKFEYFLSFQVQRRRNEQ